MSSTDREKIAVNFSFCCARFIGFLLSIIVGMSWNVDSRATDASSLSSASRSQSAHGICGRASTRRKETSSSSQAPSFSTSVGNKQYR